MPRRSRGLSFKHILGILLIIFLASLAGILVFGGVDVPREGGVDFTAVDNLRDRAVRTFPEVSRFLGAPEEGEGPRSPEPVPFAADLSEVSSEPIRIDEEFPGLSVRSRDTLRLRYNLALISYQRGDTEEALAAFRDVMDLDPQNEYARRAYINSGNLLLEEGRVDEAIRFFENAKALDEDDPAASRNLGLALLAAGNLEAAVAEFENASRLDPADPETLLSLGNARYQSGDLPGAISAYRRALEGNETYGPAHYNLGLAQYDSGEIRAATDSFRRAAGLVTGPLRIKAYSFLGVTLYERGLFEEAAEAFARAAALDPSNPNHRYNRGVSLSKAGGYREAAVEMEAAARARPGDASAWINLGSIEFSGGNHDAALAAYERGLSIDTTSGEAQFVAGFILLERGDLEGAERHFNAAVEAGGRAAARAHVNLGLILESRADLEGAAAEYGRGDMTDPLTSYNLGLVLRRLGRLDESLAALQNAVALAPENTDYLTALADVLYEGGAQDGAANAYERLISLSGEDPEVLLRLGYIYKNQNRLDEAEERLSRALGAEPNDHLRSEILVQLAAVLDDAGRTSEAVERLAEAARADRTNPQIYFNLGVMAAGEGDYDRAVSALMTAKRLAPNDARIRTQLGNIYFERGLTEEARREYEAAVAIDSSEVNARLHLEEIE